MLQHQPIKMLNNITYSGVWKNKVPNQLEIKRKTEADKTGVCPWSQGEEAQGQSWVSARGLRAGLSPHPGGRCGSGLTKQRVKACVGLDPQWNQEWKNRPSAQGRSEGWHFSADCSGLESWEIGSPSLCHTEVWNPILKLLAQNQRNLYTASTETEQGYCVGTLPSSRRQKKTKSPWRWALNKNYNPLWDKQSFPRDIQQTKQN